MLLANDQAAVRRVLAVHPAWAGLVDSSSNGEIWIRHPNGGGVWKPSDVIGGLMARGKEAGEDGFAIACTELSQLLEPDAGGARDSRGGELLMGYAVVLVQGLMVREDVRIGDDTMMIDSTHSSMRAYWSRLAPDAAMYGGWKSVAAIVKPFRWKPEFCERDDDSAADGTKVGSFLEAIPVNEY